MWSNALCWCGELGSCFLGAMNTWRHCWDRQGSQLGWTGWYLQVCRWLARGTLEGRFETRVEDAFSGWLWLLHEFQVHSTSYDAFFSCLELEQKTAPTSSLPLRESQYNRMFLPAPLTLMWYVHPMPVEGSMQWRRVNQRNCCQLPWATVPKNTTPQISPERYLEDTLSKKNCHL